MTGTPSYMQQSRHDDGKMTREQAVKWVKFVRDVLYEDKDEEIRKALDMAIEALSADAVGYETTATINEPISIQSNYVYVVRCKDCKHGEYDATHYFCAEHGHKVYEDDFCSRGERRSNRGEEVNGFKSVGQAWNTSQGRWEP